MAIPAFSLPGGTYETPVHLTLSTSTPGATVHWTTNGSEPTTGSSSAQPIPLPLGTTTVRARAFRSGWMPSAVQAATYVVNPRSAPPIVATPAAGTYDIGQPVSLATSDPTVDIRYTLDGSEPTTFSPFYFGPIVLHQPATLRAKGFRASETPSVLTAVYVIRVAQPTITPGAGEYDPMPQVTIAAANPGATIRYTIDRNEPTAQSPVYAGPFVVGSDMTIKAQAFQAGWAPSLVTTQTYLSSIPVDSGSPAVVTTTGVSETGLNVVGGSITFLVGGATLSTDPADAWVYHNGRRVPASQVRVFTNGVGVPGSWRMDATNWYSRRSTATATWSTTIGRSGAAAGL